MATIFRRRPAALDCATSRGSVFEIGAQTQPYRNDRLPADKLPNRSSAQTERRDMIARKDASFACTSGARPQLLDQTRAVVRAEGSCHEETVRPGFDKHAVYSPTTFVRWCEPEGYLHKNRFSYPGAHPKADIFSSIGADGRAFECILDVLVVNQPHSTHDRYDVSNPAIRGES